MPSLLFDFKAQFASVLDGLDRIGRDAKKTAQTTSAAFEGMKGLIQGLFAGFTVGAFVGEFNKTIDLMAKFKDASEQTGTSVETFTSLFYDLREGGASIEEITGLTTKLSKSMVDASDKTSEQAQVFKNLGISTRDSNGNLRDVTEVLREFAVKLSQSADGTEKLNYATIVLGKSGAQAMPMLNDLAEVTERSTGITAEAIKKGDEFDKALNKLAGTYEQGKIALVSNYIEPLTDLIRTFIDAQNAGVGFLGMLDNLQASLGDKFRAAIGMNPLGGMVGALNNDLAAIDKQIAAINESRDKVSSTAFGAAEGVGVAVQGAAESQLANLEARRKEILQLIDQNKKFQQDTLARTMGSGPWGREARGSSEPRTQLATVTSKTKKEKQEKDTEGEKMLAQLEKQIIAEQKLTEVQEARFNIAQARRKDPKSVSEGEERLILFAAEKLDQQKAINEAKKTEDEIQKLINTGLQNALEKENQRVAYYQELIDPVEKYRTSLREITELESKGKLDSSEANRARDRIIAQMDDLDKTKQSTKDVENAAREMGLTFTSAAEEAVGRWQGFRKLLGGIAEDLRKLAFRKLVTEPFLNMMTESFKAAAGAAAGTSTGYSQAGVPTSGGVDSPYEGPNLRQIEGPNYGFDTRADFNASLLTTKDAPTINVTLNGSGVTMPDVQSAVRRGVTESNASAIDEQRRSGVYGG